MRIKACNIKKAVKIIFIQVGPLGSIPPNRSRRRDGGKKWKGKYRLWPVWRILHRLLKSALSRIIRLICLKNILLMRNQSIWLRIFPQKHSCFSSNFSMILINFPETSAKKKATEDQSAKFHGPQKVLQKSRSPTQSTSSNKCPRKCPSNPTSGTSKTRTYLNWRSQVLRPSRIFPTTQNPQTWSAGAATTASWPSGTWNAIPHNLLSSPL